MCIRDSCQICRLCWTGQSAQPPPMPHLQQVSPQHSGDDPGLELELLRMVQRQGGHLSRGPMSNLVFVFIWLLFVSLRGLLAGSSQDAPQVQVRRKFPLPWPWVTDLSLIHISEPTRLLSISYAVFCLKKKK
eukprot:TRINITY_DN58633_c0_g1_i1.p1 TRINITY_DN58633_c0_g1~~TRINITY_DN58633_c0_g1_i1.p1  ORF type:complete len:132 (+),score=28.96 TRINITY_DN58633_c0_g1_i1:135-530(+)